MEKQLVKTLLFAVLAFFATTANAQHTGCFGVSSVDTDSARVDEPATALKWYDFSTYKFKGGGKRAVWIAYAAAGILHGGREAYHAEPTVFEKRLNVGRLSFLGSEQWKRQYYNRDPENMPHKPELWNSLRDYWHFSHTASATVWVSGAFIIGASKQPLKYRILDAALAGILSSGTASLTYEVLRWNR